MSVSSASPRRGLLDMTGYQWTVLLAAWLGWGFDVFDGLLFNYVAPNCVPTLLRIPIGSRDALKAVPYWTGIATSVLLLSWAFGGILFGNVADRIGRTKTLLLTMTLYAVGTAACAFAPNIWVLLLCRVVAGLGIGGEWAAGASMVAEVVPEKRRVEAGALLYTSAPIALFLATFVVHQIAGVTFAGHPETSWRYVFLAGLVPAAVALLVRAFVREPERWRETASRAPAAKIAELFRPENRALTISGLIPALSILITWWSCNAFIAVLANHLNQASALAHHLDKALTAAQGERWRNVAYYSFNWGGLLGTLLTIPAAKYLGRRRTFGVYMFLSAVAMLLTFHLNLPPLTRLGCFFWIGLTIFGIFGSFTYYLPELFPTRLRATGAGFCYNTGRIIAAAGPFLIGYLSSHGTNDILRALFCIGFVPLIGLCFLPWVIETRGRTLAD